MSEDYARGPAPVAAGQHLIDELMGRGYAAQDVMAQKQKITDQLLHRGYKPSDVEQYWGDNEAPTTAMDKYHESQLSAVPPDDMQRVANSPIEMLRAAWGNSVTGLMGGKPKFVLPEHMGALTTMMTGAVGMVGDLPAAIPGMFLGAAGGAAAGAAVPGLGETGISEAVGGVIGGGAGFNAMPQAMREIMLDAYNRGEIHSFSDFLGMAGKSLINTGKAALEGAIAAPLGYGAGRLAGAEFNAAGKFIGLNALGKGADAVTQALTYTAVGGALDGKVPSPSDFATGAVLALGFHVGVTKVSQARGIPKLTEAGNIVQQNLEHLYREHGITPETAVQLADQDPALRQSLLAQDVNGTPAIDAYRKYAKPDAPPENPAVPVSFDLEAKPKEPEAEPEQTPAGEPQTTEQLNQMVRDKMFGEQPKTPATTLRREWGKWVTELGPAKEIDKMLLGKGFSEKSQMLLQDQFRQTYASDARAAEFITNGGVTIKGDSMEKSDAPSVMDAVRAAEEDGGNLDDWKVYMVTKRAIDKEAKGFDTGHPATPEQRAQIVKDGAGKYERATQTLQRSFDAVLDYGRDSKVFSQGQIDAFRRENPIYVSFRRIMGDEFAGTGQGSGRGFKPKQPVRTFEGDDRQIADPLLASMDNIRQIVRQSDRNRAIGAVVGLSDAMKANIGLRKESSAEVTAAVAASGDDVTKPYMLEGGSKPFSPLLAARAMRGDPNPNKFLYINNGVAEVWTAKNEALVKLIRGADTPGEMNIFFKASDALASLQRAGLVTTPDFPTKVTWRHQITAFVLDPLHPPPFVTWLSGIMDAVNQSPLYHDWVRNGGAGTALVDLDKTYVARQFEQVFRETGTGSAVLNVVKHPLEFARIISERMDAAARIGYYKRAISKGYSPMKAATMGRQAYLDYAERGTIAATQTMARVVPFFRPHLLGLKQGWEAVSERPLETALYSAAAITLPQIALYAANHIADQYLPDDQKYENLPRWEKDNYYITPPIAGVRFRLQTPPNVGLPFGGFAVRALDHFKQHDPDAFNDWAMTLLQSYVPPLVPAIARPIGEEAFNTNFFTGHPLIPASLEGASGPLQYTENTTEVAKAATRALAQAGANLSPMTVENYVKEYTGTAGMLVLKALNAPFSENNKPLEPADYPFISSFLVRNPGMSAEPVENFFAGREEMRSKAKDEQVALQRRSQGAGSDEEYSRALLLAQPTQALDGIAQDLHALQSSLMEINRRPNITTAEYAKMTDAQRRNAEGMTVDEKRQLTDQIYSEMIQAAKMGNEQIAAMKALRQ